MKIVEQDEKPSNEDCIVDENVHCEKKSVLASSQTQRNVNYFELFRYASGWDWFLIVLALIASIIRSLGFPIVIVIYSEMTAMFIDRHLGTSTITHFLPLFGGGKLLINGSYAENMAELRNDSWSFGILCSLDALLMFLSGIIYVDLFNYVALNLTVRMRRHFFEATLRQDIGWHDLQSSNKNFALRITDNMEKIRNGLSETIGHFVQLLFDIIISILVSFIYGWRLTLTVSIYIPITIIINYITTKQQSNLTTQEQDAYAKANSGVEEVISAIRTVVAFNGEDIEEKRYNNLLVPARKAEKRKAVFSGLNDAILRAMLFFCTAGAFWYGAHLILDDRYKNPEDKVYTPSILMIVIAGIIVGAQHISHISPFMDSFATARGAAAAIFEVIESTSKIDPLSSNGKTLNCGLSGRIEFRDVFFSYPSRKELIVLRGLNLTINEGETVALVGSSGSGKSTCLQLLQRFYDPIFGSVHIDETNIKQYNVNWLRSNIAVVGQEPVLFSGTIEDNIRHGKMDATQKEIEKAAKAAEAHDFIIELPNGYNTEISEKGVQLSGGQRQRIAIARALIQNPKILLLDEATSALDYHSEKLIQEALTKASTGRTTLVVSHRLSAIRNANRIVYLEKGRILEDGNHEELMSLKGHYYNMINDNETENLLKANEMNEKKSLIDENNQKNIVINESNYNQLINKTQQKLSLEINYNETNIKENEGYLKKNLESITIDEKDLQYMKIKNENEHNKEERLTNLSKITENKQEIEGEIQTTPYMKTFQRILNLARSQWGFLSLGTICAILYGCSQPLFAIIYAELYGALIEVDDKLVLQRSSNTAIISIIVGIIICIACLTQTFLFNMAGSWLTTQMRLLTYRNILQQEMSWFDEKENSPGGLSARLGGEAGSVQGAIGFPLSNIIQAFANFICSFSIGFSYSWELALICLTTAPFMVASIVFDAKFTNKSAIREKLILEETSRIATETIAQIRTIAALRRETDLINRYEQELNKYRKTILQKLRYRGVVSSLGMSIMFFGYAITLAYGGHMCADGKIQFESIMKISNSMLYGLFLLAQSLAFTPAFNAALISASRLFEIIDRVPKIQSNSQSLTKKLPLNSDKLSIYEKSIKFENILFRYPSRADQTILKFFNLTVPECKTVALIGASGSGKSTCIQLLLRYYDPQSGRILIDNENIQEDLSLQQLRSRLGIVSQEPSLFERTIAENIAYGDNSRRIELPEIINAAKIANAHDFISNLPNGYETCLGARGTQLSGGQKQRIAIARALIRNPSILLLDEATSALDLQSERLVQAALDAARSGRTCIVIAHRLSTVLNADIICVLQHGQIVESGNHMQLMAQNGIYAKLYRSQPNLK